ncbi:probable cathepsin C [Cyclospora cayetanensis]|uniref:Probable cathepsin C n=1 Tax=Cyclospora cayetanensis TaxID=88456 RepID=A0A6P6RVP9_9EIME|nr:probable cathepsin C [Cyclospora cayetanensis]
MTPSVASAIHTCGSGTPNKNTENLQPLIADPQTYLKSHGGVSKTLELQLTDDLVPFASVRETNGNPHRQNWKALAVKDSTNTVVGGWTTVYDEGFEVHLLDKTRLMALMRYSKKDSCPTASNGDLEDRNGRTTCYTTDASRTQIGWYYMTASDGSMHSGCFYGEKKLGSFGLEAAPSFVAVRQQNHTEGAENRVFESPQGTSPSFLSEVSYYLSKEYVDKHNEKPTSTWKAAYDSSFIQKHRSVLSSLVKDFGYSKFNTAGGVVATPSFLQDETGLRESVSTQLYACPCKEGAACLLTGGREGRMRTVVLGYFCARPWIASTGDIVQDTRKEEGSDASSAAVLSPISMLHISTADVSIREHDPVASPHSYLTASSNTSGSSGSLPKAFAWPNPFADPSFTEEATNQGDCGSCYALAAVYALEERFNIGLSKLLGQNVSAFSGIDLNAAQATAALGLSNSSAGKLSPQSILACSFYNQGCHGGFPYLVGKHATEMGILQDGCMPYNGMDLNSCPVLQRSPQQQPKEYTSSFLALDSESNACHVGDQRWFASDYGYVGGCYECSQCSGEENIMREIMESGPVTAAFDAPASLFSYTSGVYDTEDAPHARVCDTPGAPGASKGLSGWEFTNHAVNLVGWGETEGSEASPPLKYWIVRNTWGSGWGNRGYFLLRRGKNVGGIESQVSFIDPDFTRGMGKAILETLQRKSIAS